MNGGVPAVVCLACLQPRARILRDAFLLTITSDVPDVTIRYTLNGSAPNETNGTPYAAPIPLSRTTVVRAAALKPGLSPTEPVTHTYVFLADVLRQTNSVLAGAHWDTEMDPQVVNNTTQTWTVTQGLVDLPTLSIVMADGDLFARNSIYYNPTGPRRRLGTRCVRRILLSRPIAVIARAEDSPSTAASRSTAITAGSQHQPKHSFRLVFKDKWGPAKLECPALRGLRGHGVRYAAGWPAATTRAGPLALPIPSSCAIATAGTWESRTRQRLRA